MKNTEVSMKYIKVILNIIIIFIFSQFYSLAQNLEWKLFNNDCGKNITDIFEYEPNKFIVKSELGFFKIHDGNSEEIIFPLSSNYIITSINMDSKGILYVATEKDGVFRYIYSKNQWEDITYNLKKTSSSNPHQIAINNSDEIVICISKISFYKMIDSSRSWAYLGKNLSNDYFSLQNNGDIYSVDSKTFSYLPKGDTVWKKEYLVDKLSILSYESQSYESQRYRFKINQSNNEIYLINHDGGIYYSEDYFKTLHLNNVVCDVFNNFNKLLITKEKEWIMISSSEGVLYSNNNAKTFEQNNEGLSSDSVLTGIITKNDYVIISIKNQGIYISEKPKNILITDNMGWLDRPNFKARKVFNCYMMDLKISNDGNKIFSSALTYMYGGNHIIQLSILDVETGELLKNYRIPSDDLMYFKVSDDDKYIIAYYLTYVFNSFDYTVKVVIYDIDDLSIKHQVKFERKNQNCNLNFNNGIKYFNSIYDDSKKEMIFAYTLPNLCQHGNHFNYLCEVIKIDFNQDSIQTQILYNKSVKNLTRILGNKLLFWEYDFISYNYTPDVFKSYSLKITDYDFNNQIVLAIDTNVNNNKYSDLRIFLYNQAKNQLIVRNYPRSIYIFDLNSNSLLSNLILKEIYPETFDLSVDGKRMIIFHNNGISIYKFPEIELLDSIPFRYESGYWWRPAVSPDNKSFAVGTFEGVVRLFKDRLLVSVPEEQTPEMYRINNNLSLSPNPATDYINIQTSEFMKTSDVYKIQIFDILGIEVSSAGGGVNEVDGGGSIRIDISNLPVGVYFIRIGDKVEKFLKM